MIFKLSRDVSFTMRGGGINGGGGHHRKFPICAKMTFFGPFLAQKGGGVIIFKMDFCKNIPPPHSL